LSSAKYKQPFKKIVLYATRPIGYEPKVKAKDLDCKALDLGFKAKD